MLRFITTADTEILAAAAALDLVPDDFPALRCANPAQHADAEALVDELAAGARVVVVRLLGGRRAWEQGFDLLHARCVRDGIALVALGGEAEPDAELAGRSTVTPAVVAEAHEYLRHGGVENTAQLLRFLGDTLLVRGDGFAPPQALPDHSAWDAELGDASVADVLTAARERAAAALPEGTPLTGAAHRTADAVADRPVIGIVFYRSHRTAGNTGFIATLAEAVVAQGGIPLPVWCGSLRPGPDGRIAALDLLGDGAGEAPIVDALLTTVLASGGSTAGDNAADEGDGATDAWQVWDVARLEELGVPVIQAAAATQPRERWKASDAGLTPLDVAMQVAIPEFDGRILGGVVSFKERETVRGARGGEGDAIPVMRYVADRDRAARVAGLAVRHGRLRRLAATRRRIAIALSSSPTKHSRIGNAVGLDTPASAVVLLRALIADGQRVDASAVPALQAALDADDVTPAEATAAGEALIHALIQRGGHDPELLTDDQLAANPYRLPGADYAAWFATLPEGLRSLVERDHGPGYVDGRWVAGGRAGIEPQYTFEGDVVVAGIELGDVFVAIQPPRATSEEDAAALSHDAERAAPHHYFAVYRWLEAVWGADALVHLGKHGTLEWLPGKSIGLSGDCHPDAILGSLPLVYPFVVNDPGEGVQSKRRVHATIVDHLVPPMMRAETYDELQELEHLLDEYVRVEALDPEKLPGLARRIWEVVESADLQHDLGFEHGGDEAVEHLDHLVQDIDTYLCSIKDLQVRDGLHVLGRVPEEEQLRGLAVAILRLGSGDVPGLRVAVGRAFGLDEEALIQAGGARLTDLAPPAADDPDVLALVARFPGPAATAGDLIDRLDVAQRSLVDALGDAGWPSDATTVAALATRILGRAHADVERVLRYAAGEVVPRIRRSTEEIDHVVGALSGRYVPSGPSGSPTRGRLDVLPTGRNFYGVDPKALPSELSWETGRRLADDLVRRHVEEEGRAPEQIGIVVWGTANMRTHGDDVAEIFALLGVEPVWHRETRRVVDLRVIPLEELGRPRVDVTVRISGFFRDAFPGLITLIDDAVALVAELDEPDDQNPIRKHVREDVERLTHEVATGRDEIVGSGQDAGIERQIERRATTRVFGSKPGTYGAGLLELVDSRSWHDRSDLAAVYEAWGGYAYGRGLDGAEAHASMREQFGRIEVAVKNLDTREHDIFDSDGYFQYHGGMVAMVQAVTGREPKAWFGDSADPTTVETRTLAEEARRVVRSRVLNPRWVAGMIRHGYKGAMELSVTVDYLFGYDATAGVVEDWMYEKVTDRYVGDPDVHAFLTKSSPWALRQIAERLLEAADRGLWEAPDEERLEQLRDVLLEVEGEVEEAGHA
ncbi:CobN component of cobalt chelatase involved in B12 biosynthesis [Patulibacter medicamentivorans]|uniref:CobN component of cobalt chelatase involved in B12 biosynthesis n=1 Tax=Patulibacter medicamentivorans TaxID=1097667 RepID=H0E540_9ACTN|nr:cobaltochelatase subunit CobN [Patulibacter medicamentivorans]EHN11207.1 CobN component of cobalt chelatase involved in B12 biosynthesis [Patulibacter medicamentivorans]